MRSQNLDVMIAAIVDELAANLVARNSIGHIGAAQLLLTAGDNPERLRSEASFASLCGVSPVPASSGKTVRHRLNRGGDRAANSALHIIAIGRLRTDQRTKDYVARRIAEGHSKLDAIRALKRYLAREVFTLITQRRKEINATRIAAARVSFPFAFLSQLHARLRTVGEHDARNLKCNPYGLNLLCRDLPAITLEIDHGGHSNACRRC